MDALQCVYPCYNHIVHLRFRVCTCRFVLWRKTAVRLKIVRTSYGYRRTITKLTSYFGLMLMLSIADIAASIILNMPYFTVFGTIGVVFVEAKSVFENLRKDEKSIAEVQKVLLKLFENKEEMQALITFLNSQTNETKRIEE